MLFGLQVSPAKRYSKIVDVPFEITNITLSPSTKSTERATLIVKDGKDEFAVCSLTLGKIENFSTSLHFPLGSEISFALEAPEGYDGTFHLTGQYLDDDDDEEEDEFMGEYDSDEISGSGDEEDDSCCSHDDDDEEMEGLMSFESEDESEEDVVEEIIDEPPQEPEAKKKKQEIENKSEAQKKGENQKKGEDQKKPEVQKKVENQKKQEPQKKQQEILEKVLDSGLKIKDLVIGKGKKVSNGAKISIQYVGKFTNGKIFDQSKPSKPLKFVLGKGQVIRGMDQGIIGMNFGGKRLITIPPELGYGNKRVGEIPANSTLVFEISLLEQ